MNAHSPKPGSKCLQSGTELPRVVTADARKVSARQFIDALGLSSPEKREADRANMLADCVRAIHRKDTYGWPPAMVDECRAIIAQIEDATCADQVDRSACGLAR